MRKLYFALAFACLFASCQKQVVNDYYLVTIDMPRLVEGAFGLKATQPKIEVKKLQPYENDSVAVSTESQREAELQADIPLMREKELGRSVKPTDTDYMREAKRKTINEAFDELQERKVILMRVSHVEDADLKEYLDVVAEKGLNSEAIRRYIRENELDVMLYTIKD